LKGKKIKVLFETPVEKIDLGKKIRFGKRKKYSYAKPLAEKV